MQHFMCRGKIHRATVTAVNLHHVGGITIDRTLLAAAGIYPYEQVHVANLSTGARFETYARLGDPHSGIICLNGAEARMVQIGDLLIVTAYGLFNEPELRTLQTNIVLLDEHNQITDIQRIALEQMLFRGS
jgi:aspartate 1-decarboxylase